MAAAVMEGAADGGADVRDLGMVGTEMVYYAVGELGLDGGICVTASHNPKQYTGMKIVRAGALPVGGDSGLEDVRAGRPGRIRPGDARAARSRRSTSGPASSTRCSPSSTSTRSRRCGSSSTPPTGWPARCCRRCSSGCRRSRSSAATSSRTAPSRTTSRTRCSRRTARSSSRKTLEEGAALGVAYDGDADRCFFVDDTGEFVPGDFVTALLAEVMLGKSPGGTVLYDVRASWAVPRTIAAAGGTALVNRVGHAFIKHRMREEHAIFAGEVSAHYYFRDFTQADTGVVPFLLMLELISKRGEKLSEILRPFRENFFITGEINTPVADVPGKLQEIEQRYAAEGGRISHLDGVSVDFDDAGTSTCGRRTPSRCSASTSRRCPRRRWSLGATSSSP